jgi:hypothetical protein
VPHDPMPTAVRIRTDSQPVKSCRTIWSVSLCPADQGWTSTDYEIADTMTSCVANYVAEGDPNGPGLPAGHTRALLDVPGVCSADQGRRLLPDGTWAALCTGHLTDSTE